MPTYDYRCEDCSHQFETMHAMSAPALIECPACRKPSLRKLVGTGAGLLFKGSGFYQTDYRGGGYQAQAKAEACPPGGCGAPSCPVNP